ncbi:protein of unknown function [Caballeronia sp. S22]
MTTLHLRAVRMAAATNGLPEGLAKCMTMHPAWSSTGLSDRDERRGTGRLRCFWDRNWRLT